MSEKSRPTWFRFGLRTLLLVITILCCYLAWEVNAVRQRRLVLDEVRLNPAFQITTAQAYGQQGVGGKPAQLASVSFLRRLLGDEAVQEIGYYRLRTGFSDSELARVTRAFPEANVQESQELLMEPCHPGCFPAGTLIDTEEGPRPVEIVVPGDVLTIVLPGGGISTAAVESVFVTRNRLWKIHTDGGALLTTKTQPLCLMDYTFKTAGDLQPGDQILRSDAGIVKAVKVKAVNTFSAEHDAKVFNVVLGDSQIFIAGGFLARSKPPQEVLPP
jgi:hypothetical protein